MASFKNPKRRLAILIADLFYESEQHQRALSIYQRLENRELGTLSKNEKAYVMLGVFTCLCWDGKSNEIAYLLQHRKTLIDTPSESRVYFCCGNRASSLGRVQDAVRTYEGYLWKLMFSMKNQIIVKRHNPLTLYRIKDYEKSKFLSIQNLGRNLEFPEEP